MAVWVHSFLSDMKAQSCEKLSGIMETWSTRFWFFYNISSSQNKRVTVIELRNKMNRMWSATGKLRKSKMSLGKKFQTIAIYVLPQIM